MRILGLIFFSFLLLACDPKPAVEKPGATANAESSEQEGAAKKTAKKVPTPIPQKSVRKTVDAWLDSQNKGDFESYAKTYAPKLTGVKRVGPKTYRFDRQGWLEDRRRMFKKKMVVTIDDIDIKTASKSAVVRFKQTWQAGSFKDVGPKQLVLVDTNTGVKIAREEMLASSLLSGGQTRAIYDPTQQALVAESMYVVLAWDAPTSWRGKTETTFNIEDMLFETTASKAVPKGLRLMADLEWEVHNTKGKTCTSKGELVVIAHAVPHFGQAEYWKEENLSNAAIAKEFDELAGKEGRYLALKLEDCRGIWSHPTTKKPSVFHRVELPKPIRKKLRSAWTKLPVVKRLQRDFEKETNLKKTWWGDDTDQGFELRTFSNGERVFATTATSTGVGCGEFEGSAWAIWEVTDGVLKLMTDGTDPGEYFFAELAADTNGDGLPEFFGWTGLAQFLGPVFRRTQDVTAPYYGCPC